MATVNHQLDLYRTLLMILLILNMKKLIVLGIDICIGQMNVRYKYY